MKDQISKDYNWKGQEKIVSSGATAGRLSTVIQMLNVIKCGDKKMERGKNRA